MISLDFAQPETIVAETLLLQLRTALTQAQPVTLAATKRLTKYDVASAARERERCYLLLAKTISLRL